jgi:hypothetical protein
MTKQEEFRYWVARTFFVTAWADWKDRYGGGAPGCGCNLMDAAPETPDYVYVSADTFISRLGDLDALFAKAAAVWQPNRPGGHTMVEELGYCAAMEAMGAGVGWTDYQDEFDGCRSFPYHEFSYYELDDEHYPIPEETEGH